ncbi:MAG: hypothetical protein AAGH83_05705 [Pseudomonadota bacterium]
MLPNTQNDIVGTILEQVDTWSGDLFLPEIPDALLESIQALLTPRSLSEILFGDTDLPWRQALVDAVPGAHSEQILPALSDALDDGLSVNGNVVGNNAAILLTDHAQSVVNFLYINPIEFFNNGRASDIYLDISLGHQSGAADVSGAPETGIAGGGEAGPGDPAALNAPGGTGSAEATQNGPAVDAVAAEEGPGDDPLDEVTGAGVPEPNGAAEDMPAGQGAFLEFAGEAHEDDVPVGEDGLETAVSGNIVDNNAAILVTDDAQNTVNFLYVNPIEFFNNGRASDIYLDISVGDEATASEPAETLPPEAAPSETAPAEAAPAGTEAAARDDGGEPDTGRIEETEPETDAESFAFVETEPDRDGLAEEEGTGTEISGNVVGNNAAILLTDNAKSTVNFLYVNPIQFFNDGRGGDIYLDVTLDPDQGWSVM